MASVWAFRSALVSCRSGTIPAKGTKSTPAASQSTRASSTGWRAQIGACGSLRDIIARKVVAPERLDFIGMTRPDWQGGCAAAAQT